MTLPDVGDLKEELLVASGRPFVVERDQRTAVRFGDESVWSTTLAADRHVTVATLVAFANAPPLEYYKQRYGRAERQGARRRRRDGGGGGGGRRRGGGRRPARGGRRR